MRLKAWRWDGTQPGIIEALQRTEKRAREDRWRPEPQVVYVHPREHAEFVATGAICEACNAVRLDDRPGRGLCNQCRDSQGAVTITE